MKTARNLAMSTNCATGAAQVAAKNTVSSVPLPSGQVLLEPQAKRRKVACTVPLNPENDTSLEIEKLKAQDPSLDPIGGWF